jgi:hypothetical protein
MPPRRLKWEYEALGELGELLSRRTNKVEVHECIESHACLVAEELNIATVEPGPSHFYVYVFTCADGDVRVPVRLVFDADDEEALFVLSCRSVSF